MCGLPAYTVRALPRLIKANEIIPNVDMCLVNCFHTTCTALSLFASSHFLSNKTPYNFLLVCSVFLLVAHVVDDDYDYMCSA
jgi:hypothetical protein